MTFTSTRLVIALVALVALIASTAGAQSVLDEGRPEFSLGIGYAHLSLGSDSSLDGEDALRFEPSLTFSPIAQLPQLRIGANSGFSLVLDNSSRTIISSGGALIFRGSSDVPLWTIEPELRLSWRQTLGRDHQFFIEPGVAGGAAFGFLSLNSDTNPSDSYDADSSTAYYRVFLRAGALVPGGTAGFEASWLSGGRMNFGGDAAGDLKEWYIGFFGAILF